MAQDKSSLHELRGASWIPLQSLQAQVLWSGVEAGSSVSSSADVDLSVPLTFHRGIRASSVVEDKSASPPELKSSGRLLLRLTGTWLSGPQRLSHLPS